MSEQPVIYLPPGSDDPAWAFDYAPGGWRATVQRAVDALPAGTTVRRIKSDLGRCDSWFNGPSGDVANRLREASGVTCEFCAAPAYGRVIEGWLSTVCDEHAVPGIEPTPCRFEVRDA